MNEMKDLEQDPVELFEQVAELIEAARHSVIRTTNVTMVTTYFLIGKSIVEYEQSGKIRAEYAKSTLKNLSVSLKKRYGKGYSEDNLSNMRRFYSVYSISENYSRKLSNSHNSQIELPNFRLSWSHYLFLCRLKSSEERRFYEIEAAQNYWNLDELKRQFNAALYERLILSADKERVKELSTHGQIIKQPKDLIKDPYILEFLGLEDKPEYSETEFETAIINKIENFILELGKGFFFGGRQVRFTFNEKHYRIDLVFYNRLLKCFVLIDLKIGSLTHEDLGQMQMYVNYYDRYLKNDDEHPTIGIIICKDKDDAVVEITLPEGNNQIFAAQYQLYLPSKEELRQLIDNA